MKLPFSASIAISFLLLTQLAVSGTRPHYGGTLRIQSRDSVTSLENIYTSPNTVLKQQLAENLFERLTRLDDSGNPQPSLAVSWHSDSQQRVWQFQLRSDAIFSNDAALTSADVMQSISKAAPQWKVTAQGDHAVVIEADVPTPHLPELLSLPEFSISKTDADGTVMGSGAFRVETFQAARRIVLVANDDYWGGRPYLDRIEIAMGGSVREELINRRLDADDIVELSLDQARTLGYGAQSNPITSAKALSVSQPSDLYALVFFRANAAPSDDAAKNPTDDQRIREAIARTVDRSAISRVLLQKEADSAPSLLPQWMTGYNFLFDALPDLEHARKLRNEAIPKAAVSIPVAYDATDNVARQIAERVAVNAREANVTLQLFGEQNLSLDSAGRTGAQAVLVRMPLASNAPTAALSDLEMRTGFPPASLSVAATTAGAESQYAAEKTALDGFRLIPIAFVPQIYWLNPRVRDWTTPLAGGWHVQDTWVDGGRPASSPAATLR